MLSNGTHIKRSRQYVFSILSVLLVSLSGFYLSPVFGYQVVALLLLVMVSLLSISFHIRPVLCAAILSALLLNFFFIPPTYTFHIATAEDLLLFAIYFVVVPVSAVLSYNMRQAEKKARDKEEKEKTIQLYNTLLNSLSHELRTPIAAIIGSADTLKENNLNLSDENKASLLAEIETAGMRLNVQVENLLNMSRLESGILKLNLDWCDVNELVFSVLQHIPPQHQTHTIRFEPDYTLPLFKIDIGIMEQVLQNIILNALVHTPQESTTHVQVLYQNENCTLIISDNGTGFPEKTIPYVFDKFYRLPNSGAGGTGLGLSIAKGFVEAHNGNIVLTNNPSGGASFTINIPAEVSFINNLKHE